MGDQPALTMAGAVTQHEIPDTLVNNSGGTLPPESGPVRVASYSLNHDKLVSSLVAGAAVGTPDITVTVNSVGGNVNIQCSTGFFHAVAKPSLLKGGFPKPPSQVIGFPEVMVVMPLPMTTTMDNAGRTQTDLLKFEMKKRCNSVHVPGGHLGNVTIHLHSTTLLIQVQGGSLMSDYNQSSAVWYTANVLLPNFQCHGKDAYFNNKTIKKLNKSICNFFLNTSPSQTVIPAGSREMCPNCKAYFRSNQVPVTCGACGGRFHKTNCLRSHDCHQSGPPAPIDIRGAQPQSEIVRNSLATSHRGHVTRSGLDSFSGGEEEVEVDLSPPPALHSTPVHFRPSALSHLVSSSTNPTTITVATSSSSPSSIVQVPTGQQYLQNLVSQPGQQKLDAPQANPGPGGSLALRGPQDLLHHQPVQTMQEEPPMATPVLPGNQAGVLVPGQSLGVIPPPTRTALPAPLVPATVTAATKPPSKPKGKRSPGLAVSDSDLVKELLDKELTVAKVKIASLDNQLADEQSRSAILLKRVQIFEKRENDAAYNQFFTSSAPPASTSPASPVSLPFTPAAPRRVTSNTNLLPMSPQPTPHVSSPTHHPAPSVSSSLPSCCPTSVVLLQSMADLQSQVAGLQQAMARIVSTLPTTTTERCANITESNTDVTPPSPNSPAPPIQVPETTQQVQPEVTPPGESASELLLDLVGPVVVPPAQPGHQGVPHGHAPGQGPGQGGRKPSRKTSRRKTPLGPPSNHQALPPSPIVFPPPLWLPPPILPPLLRSSQPNVRGPPPLAPPPLLGQQPPSLPKEPPRGKKPNGGRVRGRGRGPKPSVPVETLLIDLNF